MTTKAEPGELTAEPTPTAEPLFKGRPIDWLLFGLAMVSLGLLVWQNVAHVTRDQLILIRLTDYSVCTIFAGEFFWRWHLDAWTLRYLSRNWYAFLGMIPVSAGILHTHPWWRLLFILARFGRAIDRILGEGFTYRLVNRFKDYVINAVSGIVTITVLNRVEDVLVKGTYTRNIARALAENEEHLREMVLDKLKADPQTRRLAWLPYHDAIVQSVVSAVLRVTENILNDPRTDELVADMLRENLAQLREAVEQQEADRK
jgi:hypothetical protein